MQAGLESFDYIVVGGGSAGCAVANRLVSAGRRVLLLEAGPRDNSPFVHIPATTYKVIGSRRNWAYETEVMHGLGGRSTVIHQGKTLGGGSSSNGMVYIRGQAEDYDGWQAAGCTGWSWSDVLPFFKKSEGNQRIRNEFHGNDGPLKVSDPLNPHELCDAFIKAGTQVGLPLNTDFNGRSQIGVGYYQTTTFQARRWSAARAYLASVRDNPLLRIETGARVLCVVTENGAAAGVRYRKDNGQEFQAAIREEVILSAGAFASPTLLQLSGIGPAAHLASLSIPVIRDVPQVGQNLQDHCNAVVTAKLKHPISIDRERTGLRAAKHVVNYALFRSGVLASSVFQSGGFADTDGDGRADVQYHMMPSYGPPTSGVERDGRDGMAIMVYPIRPKSRGFTRLRSADPTESPQVDPGYLSHHDDVLATIRGVLLARQIIRAPALAAYVEKEVAPSSDDKISDAALGTFVRRVGGTVYHPAGTCRMGTDEDAVVDPRLRVRSVGRLRVADASVMPMLISGNTNATSIMIGERCAAFILGEK